jgi:AcrR family transcriptional regulator
MSSKRRSYELKARAERQQETRRRIVEATAALHEEVGPARTTVAGIARRAAVQRLTVYTHFPSEEELFAACQGRFLSEHPVPDFAPALALEDPAERVDEALRLLYEWYRARAPMTARVLRDRAVLPALDALLRRTLDVQLAGLAEQLTAAFRGRGAKARRVAAAVGLATEFFTWERLDREGLDDAAAARLMADLVAAAAA